MGGGSLPSPHGDLQEALASHRRRRQGSSIWDEWATAGHRESEGFSSLAPAGSYSGENIANT